jgi:hypothetical protein
MHAMDDDHEWINNELSRIATAQRVKDTELTATSLLSQTTTTTAASYLDLFDVQLTAPCSTLREVYPLLPGLHHPSQLVDTNIVASPFSTMGAAETSVYDQQESTLVNGKSGREGGVSTSLDFLPGGMKQATPKCVDFTIALTSADRHVLSSSTGTTTAAAALSDEEKKTLIQEGGRAPGLEYGLTLEDERNYFLGQGLSGANLTGTSTHDMLKGTRNNPDLLGQYTGAVEDPEFRHQVQSKLRDGRGISKTKQNTNTVAFTNIFADVDEEHYLLGGSSSDEDSSEEEDGAGGNADQNRTNEDNASAKAIVVASEIVLDQKEQNNEGKEDEEDEDAAIDALLIESQTRLSSTQLTRKRKLKWARTDDVSVSFPSLFK